MSFQILACGSNGLYQLGLGNDEDHETLQIVSGLADLAHVTPKLLVFGGNHTFILYPDGNLFAAGNNEHGQCGVEFPAVLKTFTHIPGQWKAVAAGWEYSVLCSTDGQVYTCGLGPKGELGLGPGKTLARRMEKVELPESGVVDEIKSSINHTVIKLESGVYIGWGVARKGQLGPQDPVTTPNGKLKPKPALWEPAVLNLGPIRDFCMGRDRTVISSVDHIRILGSEAQELPVHADTVKAMWSSIHYIETGQIRSLGNNLHGQCFAYDIPLPIKTFDVGSEHGLVLLRDNSVYAWGWGEHGNCGVKKHENVTFDYLNQVYSGPDEVVMIAGGLATTWVVVKK